MPVRYPDGTTDLLERSGPSPEVSALVREILGRAPVDVPSMLERRQATFQRVKNQEGGGE